MFTQRVRPPQAPSVDTLYRAQLRKYCSGGVQLGFIPDQVNTWVHWSHKYRSWIGSFDFLSFIKLMSHIIISVFSDIF